MSGASLGAQRVAAAGLALVWAALTGWPALRGRWLFVFGSVTLTWLVAWMQIRAARQLDRSFLAEDSIDVSNVLRGVGLSPRSDAPPSRRSS